MILINLSSVLILPPPPLSPFEVVGFQWMRLVVLGFNTTLTAEVISWQLVTHVFPGFLTPVLTQLFFPKPPTTFSHASAEVRVENMPERKVASTGDRTHNYQVTSPTRLPLSHLDGAQWMRCLSTLELTALQTRIFSFSKNFFLPYQ